MADDFERYDAACIIERAAIGNEGAAREAARQMILRGDQGAKDTALAALLTEIHRLEELTKAIFTLGLSPFGD